MKFAGDRLGKRFYRAPVNSAPDRKRSVLALNIDFKNTLPTITSCCTAPLSLAPPCWDCMARSNRTAFPVPMVGRSRPLVQALEVRPLGNLDSPLHTLG